MHGLFNILCHINHIHKILLFLCLHPFIRRLVVMSRRSTSRFRLGDYTFNAHSTLLLPVIHIVLIAFRILFGSIIYMCVCMYVCMYIYISEHCGAKQSLHLFTKANSIYEFGQAVSSSVSGLSWTYYKHKLCKILNVFWEILFCFHEPAKFSVCLVTRTISAVYKKTLTVKCFVVFVNYCAHRQNVYPILTNRVVHVEVTGTVPVGYIAVECDVTLFTVEQKKLRIRHYYVY